MDYPQGKVYLLLTFIVLLIAGFTLIPHSSNYSNKYDKNSFISLDSLQTEIIISTFLGNQERNFYGVDPPSALSLVWRHFLGEGITVISRALGERKWKGAGWTGQPLLIKENDDLFLIQGAFDHHLKKINAKTGKLVWQYKFDDVVKGTGTLWDNVNSTELKNRIVILQGSRLGVGNFLDSKHIPSYRAISYFTGEELWRLDVKWTDSYSRDVDGSAIIINDTAYIGLENSLFTVFNPDYNEAALKDRMLQPQIFQELLLYKPEDVIAHKNNVVTESSPCVLGDRIYITSGAGWVFGYNLITREIDWEFFIGSDLDGSPVVTSDSCILVTVERQYITGRGGVFKLNPRLPPEKSVVWFFPTENKEYAGWEGGIIGSPAVNDYYSSNGSPTLAAFMAIDGNLYVVDHTSVEEGRLVLGPNEDAFYNMPKLVFKDRIGPSISTPLLFNNHLIAAGYRGIRLYGYSPELDFTLLDFRQGVFESTPIVYDKKLYIASRDGYLYCLGEKKID